ncbi:MAG: hypothetical protein HC819_04855 [Cyclobacteriaceae bacterium]|nr:hypothetical protein [Cyclobacteriaceae bacterium]
MGNLEGEMLQVSGNRTFEKLSLEEMFDACTQLHFSCALYRLPNTAVRHLIIDLSAGKDLQEVTLDELGNGFIFHPFSSDSLPVKFIKSDIHIEENLDSGHRDIYHNAQSSEVISALCNQVAHKRPEQFACNKAAGKRLKIPVRKKDALPP